MKNTTDLLHNVSSLSPDALLQHSSWMRRLVSQLVKDAAQVEDLVQDAWAAALQNPPPVGVPLGAWLSGIVRRTALAKGRGDARRRQREETRAHEAHRDGRGEGKSVADLSACADEQRFVLEALSELPEEQRDVLLLRFYEDLPPRKIAERLGAPVNTIRTRQRLGVERLRAQLDQRHGGDSSAWAAVLLPLAGMGGRGIGIAAGAAGASVAAEQVAGWSVGLLLRLVGAGVLLLAAGGVGWWMLLDKEAPDLSQHTTPEVALAAIAGARGEAAAQASTVLEPIAPVGERVEAEIPGLEFRGLVVDRLGNSIEGARVEQRDEPLPNQTAIGGGWPDWVPPWRMSDDRGRFTATAAGPDDVLFVTATHPEFAHVAEVSKMQPGEETQLVMVPTATTTVEVLVVDEDSGEPLTRFAVSGFQHQDAWVKGERGRWMLRSNGESRSGVARWTQRFAVDRPLSLWLPDVAGDGFGPDPARGWNRIEVEPVPGGVTRARFVVQGDFPETSGAHPVARGSVVDDATGQPIPGALVWTRDKLLSDLSKLGGREWNSPRRVGTRTDGAFAIAIPTGASKAKAKLFHEQYVPLDVELVIDPAVQQEFRLRRRGGLSGTIVDKAGIPVPGAPLLVRFPDYREGVTSGWDSARMLADVDGRFEVPDLIDGRVTVFVLRKPRDADENAISSSTFRMQPGKSRDVVVRIDRPERCHVTGEVSNRTGTLPRHVPAFLSYADEGGWTIAKAGTYGFDAGSVERGRYLVALLPKDDGADGPMAFIPNVEVSGLGAQRFSFVFPTSSLEGSVSPENRRASAGLEGFRVLAVPDGLSGFAADMLSSAKAARSFGALVNQADGSFRIEHLSAGGHTLELWGPEPTASEPLATRSLQVSGSQRIGEWSYGAPSAAPR